MLKEVRPHFPFLYVQYFTTDEHYNNTVLVYTVLYLCASFVGRAAARAAAVATRVRALPAHSARAEFGSRPARLGDRAESDRRRLDRRVSARLVAPSAAAVRLRARVQAVLPHALLPQPAARRVRRQPCFCMTCYLISHRLTITLYLYTSTSLQYTYLCSVRQYVKQSHFRAQCNVLEYGGLHSYDRAHRAIRIIQRDFGNEYSSV